MTNLPLKKALGCKLLIGGSESAAPILNTSTLNLPTHSDDKL